ncbi:MAG: Crp/Fnr family transcriptional regulator [Elusimicrobia bacterium]|nr:Crp/Fnr family transcriptional regulator [Elusimicrobiota bacterium]
MPFSKREAPNCQWCPHRKNCLFDYLGTAEARQVWKEMRVANRFKPGESIFHEGAQPAALFVVCSGKVKIFKSGRSGQELITRIESPGDLLGHVALLSEEGSYMGTAQALETSTVSMVDQKNFFDFLSRFPQAARALMKELARDVRRGENKARDIAFKPARGRLADTLLRMMRSSKPHPMVAGFKRRDLAEMAGLTLETAVRLLKDFEQRSLLRKRDKDLLILDEAKLRQLASSSS